MRIAIAASEAAPFSKTGGLADVTGALFKEYREMGHETDLFVPLYKKTMEQFGEQILDTGMEIDVTLGKALRKCRVFMLKERKSPAEGAEAENIKKKTKTRKQKTGDIFFIGNDDYFGRDELYGTAKGDYPDNDQRFVFFCRSVLETCRARGLKMDAIHCNDWQTGLIPVYLKTLYGEDPVFKGTRSVFTIHNLGYQGVFPPQAMEMTGLDSGLFNPEGLEFYGKLNLLKAGIINADAITTVSMTYAKEILTPESGFGLDGVLKKRSDEISGILNGVDYSYWDPSTDDFLPGNYSKKDLSGKAVCKKEMAGKCSFSRPDAPILCFIGRLSDQKGIDILAESVPQLIASGANVAVIGRGDEHYHESLNSLAERFKGSFFFHSAFDESTAHLCYAGADIFMMPSKYEPCGLGQLIALRYGTISVAHKTGGLIDTIENNETGFLFDEYSAESFMAGIRKALESYADKKAWAGFIKRAMSKDFSWKKPVKAYIDLCAGKDHV